MLTKSFIRSSLKGAVRSSSFFGLSPVTRVAAFHSSPVSRSTSSPDEISAQLNNASRRLVNYWNKASIEQIYHLTHVGMAGLIPAGLLLSPSFLAVPVDLALGAVLPVHMHIGLTNVILDYVPKQFQGSAVLALYVLTTLTVLGLLKINLCGAGISESVKSLWRSPKKSQQ